MFDHFLKYYAFISCMNIKPSFSSSLINLFSLLFTILRLIHKTTTCMYLYPPVGRIVLFGGFKHRTVQPEDEKTEMVVIHCD